MRAILLSCVAACAVSEEADLEQDVSLPPSWKTVDAWDHDGLGAYYLGVAIRNNAKVIAVGAEVTPSGGSIWMIRTSTTGTTSSFGLDSTFSFDASKPAEAEAIAVDPGGRVFVSGFVVDPANAWHWITLMSTSGTAGYTVVDDVPATPIDFEVESVAAYNGAIYAMAWDGGKTRVRMTTTGTSWVDIPPPPGTPTRLCVTGAGLVSSGADASSNPITLASTSPPAATWTTIDTGPAGNINVACAEVAGTIHVAGWSGTTWFVRAGLPTGWTTVDTANVGGLPLAVTGGPGNRVFITGGATGPLHDWYTRATDPTGAWGQSDRVHPTVSSSRARAHGIAYAPALGLFAVGSNSGAAVVRRY